MKKFKCNICTKTSWSCVFMHKRRKIDVSLLTDEKIKKDLELIERHNFKKCDVLEYKRKLKEAN